MRKIMFTYIERKHKRIPPEVINGSILIIIAKKYVIIIILYSFFIAHTKIFVFLNLKLSKMGFKKASVIIKSLQ